MDLCTRETVDISYLSRSPDAHQRSSLNHHQTERWIPTDRGRQINNSGDISTMNRRRIQRLLPGINPVHFPEVKIKTNEHNNQWVFDNCVL